MIRWPKIGLWGEFVKCQKDLIQRLNENFFALDALVHPSIVGFLTTPPVDPEDGETYIDDVTGELMIWKEDIWVPYVPYAGWRVYNNDDGEFYFYDGTDWVLEPITNGDVQGPAVSIDNSIARFDGITGKIIQDSNVILDDADNITGVKTLTVSNLKSDYTARTGVNGANVTLAVLQTMQISIAGTVTSVSDIADPAVLVSDQLHILTNKSGHSIAFKNNTRIVTGSGSDLNLKDGGSILIKFSVADSKWYIIGGAGSGGGGVGNLKVNADRSNGAIIDFNNEYMMETAEFQEVGQAIVATAPVTENITSQKFLKLVAFPSGGSNFRFRSTTYLHRGGITLTNASFHQFSAPDAAAAANVPVQFIFELTDATGQIGGQSPLAGDFIVVKIDRISATTGEVVGSTYIVIGTLEVI